MPPPPRDINRYLSRIRDFFLQRKYVINNRYAFEQVNRDVPTPTLPEGITHKLSANYYYTRDGRRESKPATIVTSQSTALLSDGGAESEPDSNKAEMRPGMFTPGPGLNPVTGRPDGPSPFR
ncbi:NADH dehydrogenase [ubiquinone] 1 alpha subcomplex subunit 7-like [Watersipora subatra]|uniref:NADH dehydrogenase [ubiquinone] 1 alpha subcomplex subunit 7-like n=1 Tax=Watersipora subatra TaxID=2589382 RepID=UPI00355C5A74